MIDSIQYIYLLIEREFISLKKPIYKIGRTNQSNNNRLKQYPKGSILLFQTICNNSIEIENLLIRWFKIKFTHKPDIGNEYFEGDFKKMIQEIYDVCFKSLEKIDLIVEFENYNDKTNNNNDSTDKYKIIEIENTSETSNTESKSEPIKISNSVVKTSKEPVKLSNSVVKTSTEPVKLSNSVKTQLILAKKMLKILDLEHPHNIGYTIQKSKIILFRKFYNKNKEVYNYAFNIEKELNILTILNIIFKECGNTRIKNIDNDYIIVNIESSKDNKNITIGDATFVGITERDVSEGCNFTTTKSNWIDELQKYRYKTK